jgi:alkylation response protein AidB-like acyl-CoA dehydrogenase
VASIKTQATKDGGDYVINGGKMWTTNGTQADFCCVLANTSDGPAHRNKSLIVVPMNTPGVSVSKLDNQTVHYKLAEYQAEVEALRAVADGCLQFWGGMGFAHESPISRIYRDGRLTSIGGGADEVMLQILSKYMGILPKTA